MSQSPIYLLDLSVLLHAPEVLFAFPGKKVILPVSILEELDILKLDLGEKGNSAQIICQKLDEFRQYGNLAEGIVLPNGCQFKVDLSATKTKTFPYPLDFKRTCNQVLASAWNLRQKNKNVILISEDGNIRTKANVFNIPTTSYNGPKPDDSRLFSGLLRCQVGKKQFHDLQKFATFSLAELPEELYEIEEFFPNQGLLLSCPEVTEEDILATFSSKENNFQKVTNDQGTWGIRPRNPEQRLAMALLNDPNISIVSLSGKSGTGKTLFALAVGLQKMMIDSMYSRMLVSRPIFPMGRDLGFLPGDTQEKLAPWMQPIFDNMEMLLDSPASKNGSKRTGVQEMMDQRMLVVEPLTYIRGRSIPNQYMVVDEAQNLSSHEMKTIVTRAGEGTKIVLTGDPNQIDNSNVNLSSNGLSTLVERFKKSEISGHVRFTQGERSPLAELAANVL